MQRCLQLARLGAGYVAPNPMVGSVLVHEDRIIGEGYHRQYGQAHAEVNCISSVREEDIPLIERSTLYVSLEPCAHFGKTPPCADLIIRKKIPRVVVGCRDPFVEVNGKGIEKLLAAGIEVMVGICEKECLELNKIFFTFHLEHRPYIILKWAQTADGKMAGAGNDRLLISSAYTNRLVHQWRSEISSILVGTNTALSDNPSLTTRLWPGPNPLRLVVDMNLRLPAALHLFDPSATTIVFNLHRHTVPMDGSMRKEEGPYFYQVTDDVSLPAQIIHALYQLKVTSVLIEGGSRLLQSFIDEGYWDEARVITNESLSIGEGLAAPELSRSCTHEERISTDLVGTYHRINTYS